MGASATVQIRDLSPHEAEALVACFRRCYGETYPEAIFYQAPALAAALREGRLFSKVAVTRDARIVGHLGTRLLSPGDCVAETVGGIVDPGQRGQGLLRALGGAMLGVYRELSLAGIWLFATGAHLRTQRPILAASGRATGVLLGHIPAGTDYRGMGHDFGAARIGAVVFYQPLGTAPPLEIHPPEPYRELLRELYGALDLQRREGVAGNVGLPGGSCIHDPRRGVSWLRFGRLAGAKTRTVEHLLEDVASRGAPIVYAEVPLCEPGAPALVARLRAAGCCFGALLPGSERSETLRLQRIPSGLIATERIALGSSQVADVLSAVLSDRAAVGDNSG